MKKIILQLLKDLHYISEGEISLNKIVHSTHFPEMYTRIPSFSKYDSSLKINLTSTNTMAANRLTNNISVYNMRNVGINVFCEI